MGLKKKVEDGALLPIQTFVVASLTLTQESRLIITAAFQKGTRGKYFSVDWTGCFCKDAAGQISALNDDPHSSHNLVQTLLKIGTRCPREEKQIPKWAYLIEYHLHQNVWLTDSEINVHCENRSIQHRWGNNQTFWPSFWAISCHLTPALTLNRDSLLHWDKYLIGNLNKLSVINALHKHRSSDIKIGAIRTDALQLVKCVLVQWNKSLLKAFSFLT